MPMEDADVDDPEHLVMGDRHEGPSRRERRSMNSTVATVRQNLRGSRRAPRERLVVEAGLVGRSLRLGLTETGVQEVADGEEDE